MTAAPDWMRPPRPEGWFAEDLERRPEAPRHTELIDGALVFMMSPQALTPRQSIRLPSSTVTPKGSDSTESNPF
jgi:hypothetical protein